MGCAASTVVMAPLLVVRPLPFFRRQLVVCALGAPLGFACASADSPNGVNQSADDIDSTANTTDATGNGSPVALSPSTGVTTAGNDQGGTRDETMIAPDGPSTGSSTGSSADSSEQPPLEQEPDSVSTSTPNVTSDGSEQDTTSPSDDVSDAHSDETHSDDGPGNEAPDSGVPTDGQVTTDNTEDSNEHLADEADAESNAGSECPHSGTVRYTFNGADGWPSDVVERLTAAMDEAVYYYNCYSDLSHELTVNYNESVPTAEANVDGWMSFGSNRGYMVVATAMHEIAHTMGVGYSPWSELLDNGRWTGSAVAQVMSTLPAEERDPDMYSQRDYITCDGQHFWPYGLNQASEHQSEWSLINHVRIVAAMRQDKDAYR